MCYVQQVYMLVNLPALQLCIQPSLLLCEVLLSKAWQCGLYLLKNVIC